MGKEIYKSVTWYTSSDFFLDNVCISIECQCNHTGIYLVCQETPWTIDWPRQKYQYNVVDWTQMDGSFVVIYAYRMLPTPIYCGWP